MWITAKHRGHLSPLLPYVFSLLCLLAFWLFSLLLLSSPNVLFFFSLKSLHLLRLSDLRREECSSLVCHDFWVCTGRGVEPQGGASRLTDKYRWKWCRSTLCHWGHTNAHTHMYSGSSPAMPLWERGERSTASMMGFTTRESRSFLTWTSPSYHMTIINLNFCICTKLSLELRIINYYYQNNVSELYLSLKSRGKSSSDLIQISEWAVVQSTLCELDIKSSCSEETHSLVTPLTLERGKKSCRNKSISKQKGKSPGLCPSLSLSPLCMPEMPHDCW